MAERIARAARSIHANTVATIVRHKGGQAGRHPARPGSRQAGRLAGWLAGRLLGSRTSPWWQPPASPRWSSRGCRPAPCTRTPLHYRRLCSRLCICSPRMFVSPALPASHSFKHPQHRRVRRLSNPPVLQHGTTQRDRQHAVQHYGSKERHAGQDQGCVVLLVCLCHGPSRAASVAKLPAAVDELLLRQGAKRTRS